MLQEFFKYLIRENHYRGFKQLFQHVHVLLSASRPAGVCVEESLEHKELQVSRQEDDETLGRRPPVDVAEVGQEDVVILPFPHPSKIVMMPHVKDLILEPLYTLLKQIVYLLVKYHI